MARRTSQATVAYRIRGLSCDISNKLRHYLFTLRSMTTLELSNLIGLQYFCSGYEFGAVVLPDPLPLNARVWLARLMSYMAVELPVWPNLCVISGFSFVLLAD